MSRSPELHPGWEPGYCPDCGSPVAPLDPSRPVSQRALDAGDDPICDPCQDIREARREEAQIEAHIAREEVRTESLWRARGVW